MNLYFQRLLLVAVLVMSPLLLCSFVLRCNSVSLHLKAGAIEYDFQKGSCSSADQQARPEQSLSNR